MPNLDRRRFLIETGAAAAVSGAFLNPAPLTAAPVTYASQHPDMLLAFVTGKLNTLAAKWDAERARIQSASDVETRNRFVREKFREMIHGYPDRHPLTPVTVTVHERDDYRVENVMFQSRPNFWVTGNLYLPMHGRAPYPGVISPCGHYPLSRMEPEYQCVYINLVKAGFVVLAYDPIGQGERRQYWDPQTGRIEVVGSSRVDLQACKLEYSIVSPK